MDRTTVDTLEELAAFISFKGGKASAYKKVHDIIAAFYAGDTGLGRVNHVAISQHLGRTGNDWENLTDQLQQAATAGAVAVLAVARNKKRKK
jgi:hypothetical protein